MDAQRLHQAFRQDVGLVRLARAAKRALVRDGNLLHCLLRLNLVNEVFHVLETLLEDLEELAVSETERNAPIDVEVLHAVHVRHLNDEVVQSCQREQSEALVVHGLQVKEILDDALDLGVVKPRHFGDFGKENNDHFGHLLVQTGFFLHQKVDHKVFYADFFVQRNLAPVVRKQLLQGRGCHELRKPRVRLF